MLGKGVWSREGIGGGCIGLGSLFEMDVGWTRVLRDGFRVWRVREQCIGNCELKVSNQLKTFCLDISHF